MMGFLILVVAIAAGVVTSVLLRRGGVGKIVRWGLGTLAGVIALVALIQVFYQNAQTSPAARTADTHEASAPSPPAKPAQPLYITTASDLFRAYDANEVATDDAMKGKLISVSGRVQSIDKDFMDDIVLQLSTGNEFMPAGMTLRSSEASKAARLNKGDIVTVQCKTMHRIMGSPQGGKCVLVPVRS